MRLDHVHLTDVGRPGPSCLPGDERGPAESKRVTASATLDVIPTVMSVLLEGSRGFWGLHAGGSLSLCADSEHGCLLRRPAPPALPLAQTGRGSSELYGGNLISNGSMVTEGHLPWLQGREVTAHHFRRTLQSELQGNL